MQIDAPEWSEGSQIDYRCSMGTISSERGVAPLPTTQPLTLPQLLNNSVRQHGTSVAAICGDVHVTYRELDEMASRLASYLHRTNIGAGDLVGVCMDRSIEMLAAVLGVLKAGAAYVPLDPYYPDSRIRFLAEDAKLRVVISDDWSIHKLKPLAGLHAIPFQASQLRAESADQQLPYPAPHDLAYVMFTSGSTGAPKGVQISHRNLTNLLESMAHQPGISSSDALVAVTSLSFDISVLELLLPLLAGARVVIAKHDEVVDGHKLGRLIDQANATTMQATPATWRMLIQAGWAGRPGLKALCGGEVLHRHLADKLSVRVGELWNLYGPTETTIWSTVHQVTRGSGPVPIGRGIANTQLLLLDENMQRVPQGQPGELLIGGAGVSPGYLNRPDLDRERFIVNVPGSESGQRFYRTGDIAKLNPEGDLEFIGRIDTQIKIRGYRIELAEVEEVLGSHNALEAAAVVAVDEDNATTMVAYAVPKPLSIPTPTDVRGHLRKTLPEYMVPRRILYVRELPLTPSGKVDRERLSEGLSMQPDERRSNPPLTQTELVLAEIWSQLLGGVEIGRFDSFFECGGDSLLAATLLREFEQVVGSTVVEYRDIVFETLYRIAEKHDAGGETGSAFASSPWRRLVGAFRKLRRL